MHITQFLYVTVAHRAGNVRVVVSYDVEVVGVVVDDACSSRLGESLVPQNGWVGVHFVVVVAVLGVGVLLAVIAW
jgi:hypothetical protein